MKRSVERKLFKHIVHKIPSLTWLLTQTPYDIDTLLDLQEVAHGERTVESGKQRYRRRN